MSWFSKKNNGIKTVDSPSVPLVMDARVRIAVEKIIGYDSEAVMPIVEKAYKVLSCYPASVKYHDSGIGGLWTHSFNVARLAAEAIVKYKQGERQYVVLAFLAGLLHDTGKIAFYNIDTQGYDFNPLSLLPHGYKIIGKRDEPEKEHAGVSAMLLFSFLSEQVKKYPPRLLHELHEAISLHHRSDKSSNPLAFVLRDCDARESKESIEKITTPDAPVSVPELVSEVSKEKPLQETVISRPVKEIERKPEEVAAPVETKQIPVQEQPQTIPTGEKRLDANLWVECLKWKLFNELQKSFHYYMLDIKDKKILAITNKTAFNSANSMFFERMGKTYDDAVVIAMLEKAGLIALRKDTKHFIKISLSVKDSGITKKRDLTFLCLDASKILSDEEIVELSDSRVSLAR